MELVHGDVSRIRVGTVAKRVVGQYFRRAADDGRGGIDRDVAGDHADVVAAEPLGEIEELLAHERLYRGGIVHALAGYEREERHPKSHRGFSAARWCSQDYVVAHRQRKACIFLVRPQLNAAFHLVVDEQLEGFVGVGSLIVRALSQPAQTGRFLSLL